MMTTALQACLERESVHARQVFRLDDELGTQHGLSWGDFVLLHALDDEQGGLPEAQLAQRLGTLRSRLLVRLLPLHKLGLVARTGEGAARCVALRPAGRRLLARETAAAVCEQA
jgi:predicted transcriptional regulator